MKRKLAALVLAVSAALGFGLVAAGPASAGSYYPPTSGFEVHYWDCKGPYRTPATGRIVYDCWADYTWWGEFRYGFRDKYELVGAIYRV